MRTFNFWEIFKRAFKIYGIWPQASKQARMITHFRNAVLLVWGSLRLAPIILSKQFGKTAIKFDIGLTNGLPNIKSHFVLCTCTFTKLTCTQLTAAVLG